MNEEEKEAVEFINDLITWDVRGDLCPNQEECEKLEIMLNLIEKLQKENEEWQRAYQEEKDKQFDFINKISSNDLIPVQKVKDKIEEMQKEYNKLDEEVDKYINDANKDLTKFYKNRERISTMQELSYFINILKELIEGRK